MVNKIAGLARALAIILAIVAAFVSIPSIDLALVLVVLGLIAGLGYSDDTATQLILAVLVLPVVAVALNVIPSIGAQLGTAATNIALAAAAAAATMLTIRFFIFVKDGLLGIVSK